MGHRDDALLLSCHSFTEHYPSEAPGMLDAFTHRPLPGSQSSIAQKVKWNPLPRSCLTWPSSFPTPISASVTLASGPSNRKLPH